MPPKLFTKRAARTKQTDRLDNAHYERDNLMAEATVAWLLYYSVPDVLPKTIESKTKEKKTYRAEITAVNPPGKQEFYAYTTSIPRYESQNNALSSVMDRILGGYTDSLRNNSVFWQSMGQALIIRYIFGDDDPGSWNYIIQEGTVKTYDFDRCFTSLVECSGAPEIAPDTPTGTDGMGWAMGTEADQWDLQKILEHGWSHLLCPAPLPLIDEMEAAAEAGYEPAQKYIDNIFFSGEASQQRHAAILLMIQGASDFLQTKGAKQLCTQIRESIPTNSNDQIERITAGLLSANQRLTGLIAALTLTKETTVVAIPCAPINITEQQTEALNNIKNLLTFTVDDQMILPDRLNMMGEILNTSVTTGGGCLFWRKRTENLAQYLTRSHAHTAKIENLKNGVLTYSTEPDETKALAALDAGLRKGKTWIASNFGSELSTDLQLRPK